MATKRADTKHLFQRGGTWWVGIMRDGKRYRETTGETDLSKARDRRDEILAAFVHRDKAEAAAALQGKIDHHLALARKIEEAAKPGIPVQQLWGRWVKTAPTASTATMRQYEFQVDAFRKWVADHHPDTEADGITPDMAAAFVRHLEGQKLTANTVNKYLVLLRRVWASLFPDLPNPWAKIEKRRGEAISRRPLTRDELATVLGKSDAEMRVLVLLGALLALRLGDAATLKWKQVDLARGMITVKPRKSRTRTGKTLSFPIVGALRGALAALPPGKPEGYVLPTLAADYLRHGTYLTDRIQNLFSDCGINTKVTRETGGRNAVEVGFHSLRHFAATMMMESNVPAAVAQAMLGHASPALLATYQHVGAGQIQAAIKQIAAQADGHPAESDADKLTRIRTLAATATVQNWRGVLAEIVKVAG